MGQVRASSTKQPDRHGDGIEVAIVDAHELRRAGIIGGGAKGAAQFGAIEHELQAGDGDDRGGEDEHDIVH